MWQIGLILAGVTLVLDRLSKWWLIYVFEMPRRLEVELTSFFKLVMWWNRGISFGMFRTGSETGRWILIALAGGIVIILLRWLLRIDRMLAAVGLGLVLGGAIGNIYDRLIYGAVADFFYFHVGDWYWPAFNVADMGISIGVVALLVDAVMRPRAPKG